ncbi:MAG: hypothetical protein GX621_17820 [Pirellulaceae bacterium]|nr:hypothetical protein [Pirellulaceae bacterium]
MTASHSSRPESNPFSTRCVRPGALPYFFPPGETIDSVLERLIANDWRGQILGPHGSGKSTLLATLLPRIEQHGMRIILAELHDGRRRMPETVPLPWKARPTLRHPCSTAAPGREQPLSTADPPSILVIDGYEQLPWWRRRLVQWQCGRHDVGLLVTAHRPIGLPAVFHTQTDPATFRHVVARLLEGQAECPTDEEINRCLERHAPNLREALFELYDLFESRREC